jgi:hypothetical protein
MEPYVEWALLALLVVNLLIMFGKQGGVKMPDWRQQIWMKLGFESLASGLAAMIHRLVNLGIDWLVQQIGQADDD